MGKDSSKPGKDIYIWLLQVIIFLVLASVVVSLCLHPKSPTFTISDVNIPALDTTNLTTPGNIHRNTTLIISLQISNPNKGIGVYYDQANVTLHHGDHIVGESSVPNFYQGHKNITKKEICFYGLQQFWETDLRMSLNSTVDVKVELLSEVRYRVLGWKTERHVVDLQGLVGLGLDGKILQGGNVVLQHTLELPGSRG